MGFWFPLLRTLEELPTEISERILFNKLSTTSFVEIKVSFIEKHENLGVG